MAFKILPVKGSNRETYGVAIDDVTQINGVDFEQTADAQILKLGHGSEGTLNVASPEFPFPTADASPALTPLAVGGVDIAVDGHYTIVASAGRVKIAVNHVGPSGKAWLGFGVNAQANVGEWIDINGRWEEFFAGSVDVLNKGASTIRVTWMEWAA